MKIKVARKYETQLSRLVTGYKLGINEKTRQINFACGVTIHSPIAYTPEYQAIVSTNPFTGMPKYTTTTTTYPEIRGAQVAVTQLGGRGAVGSAAF